jgi:hypothetical protein
VVERPDVSPNKKPAPETERHQCQQHQGEKTAETYGTIGQHVQLDLPRTWPVKVCLYVLAPCFVAITVTATALDRQKPFRLLPHAPSNGLLKTLINLCYRIMSDLKND